MLVDAAPVISSPVRPPPLPHPDRLETSLIPSPLEQLRQANARVIEAVKNLPSAIAHSREILDKIPPEQRYLLDPERQSMLRVMDSMDEADGEIHHPIFRLVKSIRYENPAGAQGAKPPFTEESKKQYVAAAKWIHRLAREIDPAAFLQLPEDKDISENIGNSLQFTSENNPGLYKALGEVSRLLEKQDPENKDYLAFTLDEPTYACLDTDEKKIAAFLVLRARVSYFIGSEIYYISWKAGDSGPISDFHTLYAQAKKVNDPKFAEIQSWLPSVMDPETGMSLEDWIAQCYRDPLLTSTCIDDYSRTTGRNPNREIFLARAKAIWQPIAAAEETIKRSLEEQRAALARFDDVEVMEQSEKLEAASATLSADVGEIESNPDSLTAEPRIPETVKVLMATIPAERQFLVDEKWLKAMEILDHMDGKDGLVHSPLLRRVVYYSYHVGQHMLGPEIPESRKQFAEAAKWVTRLAEEIDLDYLINFPEATKIAENYKASLEFVKAHDPVFEIALAEVSKLLEAVHPEEPYQFAFRLTPENYTRLDTKEKKLAAFLLLRRRLSEMVGGTALKISHDSDHGGKIESISQLLAGVAQGKLDDDYLQWINSPLVPEDSPETILQWMDRLYQAPLFTPTQQLYLKGRNPTRDNFAAKIKTILPALESTKKVQEFASKLQADLAVFQEASTAAIQHLESMYPDTALPAEKARSLLTELETEERTLESQTAELAYARAWMKLARFTSLSRDPEFFANSDERNLLDRLNRLIPMDALKQGAFNAGGRLYQPKDVLGCLHQAESLLAVNREVPLEILNPANPRLTEIYQILNGPPPYQADQFVPNNFIQQYLLATHDATFEPEETISNISNLKFIARAKEEFPRWVASDENIKYAAAVADAHRGYYAVEVLKLALANPETPEVRKALLDQRERIERVLSSPLYNEQTAHVLEAAIGARRETMRSQAMERIVSLSSGRSHQVASRLAEIEEQRERVLTQLHHAAGEVVQRSIDSVFAPLVSAQLRENQIASRNQAIQVALDSTDKSSRDLRARFVNRLKQFEAFINEGEGAAFFKILTDKELTASIADSIDKGMTIRGKNKKFIQHLRHWYPVLETLGHLDLSAIPDDAKGTRKEITRIKSELRYPVFLWGVLDGSDEMVARVQKILTYPERKRARNKLRAASERHAYWQKEADIAGMTGGLDRLPLKTDVLDSALEKQEHEEAAREFSRVSPAVPNIAELQRTLDMADVSPRVVLNEYFTDLSVRARSAETELLRRLEALPQTVAFDRRRAEQALAGIRSLANTFLSMF